MHDDFWSTVSNKNAAKHLHVLLQILRRDGWNVPHGCRKAVQNIKEEAPSEVKGSARAILECAFFKDSRVVKQLLFAEPFPCITCGCKKPTSPEEQNGRRVRAFYSARYCEACKPADRLYHFAEKSEVDKNVAFGRAVDDDVYADEPLPPWTCSACVADGYFDFESPPLFSAFRFRCPCCERPSPQCDLTDFVKHVVRINFADKDAQLVAKAIEYTSTKLRRMTVYSMRDLLAQTIEQRQAIESTHFWGMVDEARKVYDAFDVALQKAE